MTRLFITLIFLVSTNLIAQNSHLTLDIRVEDDDNNKRALDGAVVKVYQDSQLVEEAISDSLGKVKKIQIPAIGFYTIRVQKEGFASKFGTINTQHFDPKFLSGNIKFPMEVGLVRPTDTEDFAFLLKEPMINFFIDTSGEQAWDDAYLKKMLDKVEKCQKGWTAEEFEAYSSPKVKAKDLIEKEDFLAAKNELEQAQKVKDTPEIQVLIKDCDIGLAKKEGNEMMYANFIKIGDQLLDNKRYEEARVYYERAIEIKPKEPYPQEKMAKCEALTLKINE